MRSVVGTSQSQMWKAFAERLAKLVRLRERVDAGAVGRVHGVERLDRERHTRSTGVGQELGQALAHDLARVRDVARGRREAAGDDDQAGGGNGGGLVDGAAIVLERLGEPAAALAREHPAAAKAADGEAVPSYEPRRLRHAHRLKLVAPHGKGRDARARDALDRLLEVPRAHGRRVDREEAVVLGEVARHGSMPRVLSTAAMRSRASSGSASRPAASARRKSSARWRIERALSCPPTITKWR